MHYDFTTLPRRWNTGAEKFHNMTQKAPDVPEGVVPFSVADMDFLPPPELLEGLHQVVDETIFGYILPGDSYYDAILGWMDRRHGVKVRRDWLVDADNVLEALRQMILAYTQPGDKILTLTPSYPPFLSIPVDAERQLLQCPLRMGEDRRYMIDLDRLEDFCRREDVKLLAFCNPHNPVGRAWTVEELTQVADICLRHGVFIVSDEIHWDLILPGTTFTSMALLPEKYLANCAVSTAVSKTFNIAALRGGTVILPDEDRRRRYHAHDGISGRDVFSYAATEIVYTRCEAWLEELITVIEGNRRLLADFMAQRLPEVGVTPLEATYLQWLDFRFMGLDPQELENFMAYQARCFFTEGYKFGEGGAGFERWSLACPEQVLLAGLERMEKAIKSR